MVLWGAGAVVLWGARRLHGNLFSSLEGLVFVYVGVGFFVWCLFGVSCVFFFLVFTRVICAFLLYPMHYWCWVSVCLYMVLFVLSG